MAIALFPVDASAEAAVDAGSAAEDATVSLDTGTVEDRAADAALDDGGPLDAGDASDGGDADAAGPPQPSVRYDFSGTGTQIADLVGDANAVAVGGATLAGDGVLSLDGVDDYVDLPNGLVSSLSSLTLMFWVQWEGGVCWQRIFDAGSNDAGEDAVGVGVTSLFLTPAACGRAGGLTASMEIDYTINAVELAEPLPTGRIVQVALAVDPVANDLRLYVEGERLGAGPTAFTLDQIDDVNVWLGRSQWVQDYPLTATYDEFRLYPEALSDADVRRAFELGPDAL